MMSTLDKGSTRSGAGNPSSFLIRDPSSIDSIQGENYRGDLGWVFWKALMISFVLILEISELRLKYSTRRDSMLLL